MSEDGSAAAIAELRTGLAEVRDAVKSLTEANTPREKAEAREDVKDAEENLDALAKRLGISKTALEKATADARRAERKEELRPIMLELMEEFVGPDDDDPDPEAEKKDGGEKKPKKDEVAAKREEKKPDAPPAADPPPPPADDAPMVEHWTDRKVKLW